MRLRFTSLLLCVLASASLMAQNYPNSLLVDSVDPVSDSLFFAKSREKMNEIRKTYNRPTVALVLSGGGAKGAAEVGVLKYLEEIDMPIDLVCGTSIGGLVGGLYSMGYDSEDFHELFISQDWTKLLTDKLDTKYYPHTINQFNKKHLLSYNLGKNQKVEQSTFIPSGYVSGFNVNNLFSSLAVGYEGDVPFTDLPIPFACVAGDLVSLKAYNWVGGSVIDALRSTMSIPGLFQPLKTSNMILVDGGVRSNYPVDLAKAMGADYVIGVDLRGSRRSYDEIQHMGSMLLQFINMFNSEVFDMNIELSDVVVNPDMYGLNMLSFNEEAVNKLIDSGYKAATALSKELLALKDKVGSGDDGARVSRKAKDISKQSVKIKSIDFNGVDEKEAKMLLNYIEIDTTMSYDKKLLDDIMGTLLAVGYFSDVKYTLQGSCEPYDLVFDCTFAPINKLGIGFRADNAEGVAVLASFEYNSNKIFGSKISFETKFSHNFKSTLKYSYVSPHLPVLNLEASYANINVSYRMFGSAPIHIMQYQAHTESMYISANRWKDINFKLGIQNYGAMISSKDYIAEIFADDNPEDYLGAFAQINIFNYDDFYFPTKGTDMKIEARYDFANLANIKNYLPMTYFSLSYSSVLPVSPRFAIIPQINAVANINPQTVIYDEETTELTIPYMTRNFVGGMVDRRYHRNHLPFFGITKAYMIDNYFVTGALQLRYNPVDKLYTSLFAGGISANNSFFDFFGPDNSNLYAFAAEVAYKSLIGPIKLNVHWNSILAWGAVISAGFDF